MLLSHAFHLFRAWQQYCKCVRELSQLSDLELTDIGVTRSGIMGIAWQTARAYMTRVEAPPIAGASRER